MSGCLHLGAKFKYVCMFCHELVMEEDYVKPIVFVDIDGTVANSMPWWLVLYNFKHKTCWQLTDIVKYDLNSVGLYGLEEFYHNYDGVKIMEGAMVGITKLQFYANIVFVTAGFGEPWLRNMWTKEEVVRIKDRSLLRGFALIDDCEDNAASFNGTTYIVKQPWNNGQTWPEITEALIHEIQSTDRVSVSPV